MYVCVDMCEMEGDRVWISGNGAVVVVKSSKKKERRGIECLCRCMFTFLSVCLEYITFGSQKKGRGGKKTKTNDRE